MEEFSIKTARRCQFVDITSQVERYVREEGRDAGAVLIYIPHTTAGVTINESADPSVVEDILAHLEKMVPQDERFRHSEGNSDAHIKSSLVGTSCLVPLDNGKMALGTWQGIFFTEFDGPRTRKVLITTL